MSSAGFLQGLMLFDKDTITEEMVELLDAYLLMPDYTLEGAKKVLCFRVYCYFCKNNKVCLKQKWETVHYKIKSTQCFRILKGSNFSKIRFSIYLFFIFNMVTHFFSESEILFSDFESVILVNISIFLQ